MAIVHVLYKSVAGFAKSETGFARRDMAEKYHARVSNSAVESFIQYGDKLTTHQQERLRFWNSKIVGTVNSNAPPSSAFPFNDDIPF